MARIKTVFTDVNTIAHKWYYRQQYSATNSRNFFFEGKTIYSYNRSFPIAEHAENKRGEKAVLFTLRTYSNTTAKHIRTVRAAIPYDANIIYCWLGLDKDRNFEKWDSQLNCMVDRLKKAKKPELYIEIIDAIRAKVEKYAAYFDYKIPPKLLAIFELADKGKEGLADYNNKVIELQKKELASRKRRESKIRKENKKQWDIAVNKWRNFEINRMPYIAGFTNNFYMLRLNKKTQRIETSGGVEIPVKCITKLYPLVKELRANGGYNFQSDGAKLYQVLDYQLKQVTDKYIVIGCHYIETAEYEAIAKDLQLDNSENSLLENWINSQDLPQ